MGPKLREAENDLVGRNRISRREFLRFMAGAPILVVGGFPSVSISAARPGKWHERRGFLHPAEVMDQFHRTFDVYTDESAGGNHFFPSGWMGDLGAIQFDSCSTDDPRSGVTCIKNTFLARGANWAGIYWQYPENNWGAICGVGYKLTGATKVTFWVRGAVGGERVEFFVGGIGRQLPPTCTPSQPCPDSFCKVSTGFLTLSPQWQQYTIDLTSQDLSYVIGGFGWVTNSTENPAGATFYLDDIQYDLQRLQELRFLVSYQTLLAGPPDQYLKNAAFVYDNVLVFLAFMARGTQHDLTRAQILADSLVYAQNNDRFYTDGRLRNAYQAGDLADRQTGKARLPGWWDCAQQQWFEDQFQVSSYTGNMAWVIIGLLRYYEKKGGLTYLNAAIQLGDWIYTNTYDTRGGGGYTGGFDGWEPNPTKILWKSTEHNIDIYVAFMKLWELTDDPVWRPRAMWAKNFVKAMWNVGGGHFWTGTLDDGVTVNTAVIPADVQNWALMALGEASTYGAAITWVENNYLVQEPCCRGRNLKGFDFNNDRDGIWWEGTAHTVIAFQLKQELQKANDFLRMLRIAQLCAPNTNRKGIVATCHDGVTTGFNWLYYNRLHIGATAWYLFAERGHNPFWGIGTADPIPYEGQYS